MSVVSLNVVFTSGDKQISLEKMTEINIVVTGIPCTHTWRIVESFLGPEFHDCAHPRYPICLEV